MGMHAAVMGAHTTLLSPLYYYYGDEYIHYGVV